MAELASPTRKGIDTSKFMGASFAAGGGLKKQVELNSKKITLLKNIVKAHQSVLGENLKSLDPATSSLNESIQSITDSVTSIHQTLLDEQELDKDQEEDDAIADQQKKRNLKEKLVEGAKGLGKNVMAGAQKALEPVKGAFSKIFDWIKKLIMAKAVIELVNWFSDKNNQNKVSTIFRFIKDWWPAILTGLLLFAGSMLGPGGIIIAAGVLVVGFIPKLVDSVKSLLGFGKETTKDALQGEKDAKKLDAEANKDLGEDQDVTPKDIGKTPEPGEQDTPGVKKFNKGGPVPGTGDKDTVPAMLTPGEFVMTKDAVQQYGADTLANMNAAVGGKNNGSPLRGFNAGGLVPGSPGVVTDPAEKKRIEEETLYWVNKERTEFLGLPPLDKISYADGVELTKAMGKEYYGGGVKETSFDDMNFDTMERTTWRTKSRGAEIIFEGASQRLTEEDKKAYLASNPQARMALELKDQMELEILMDDINLSTQQFRPSSPGPLSKPPVTIAYSDAQQNTANNASSNSGNPGGKVPNFSPTSKVDNNKIKTLGITR